MHMLLLVLAALLYVAIGTLCTSRAMTFARANAFNDRQFFTLAIQAGGSRPSLSALLPMLTLSLLWPLAAAFVVLSFLLRSRPASITPALSA